MFRLVTGERETFTILILDFGEVLSLILPLIKESTIPEIQAIVQFLSKLERSLDLLTLQFSLLVPTYQEIFWNLSMLTPSRQLSFIDNSEVVSQWLFIGALSLLELKVFARPNSIWSKQGKNIICQKTNFYS